MAFRFVRTFRSLQRLREILGVLARHGFGHLVHKIGLRHLLPMRQRLVESVPVTGSAAARRAVTALQELGPTFVKLGQMLATRPDILPPEWIEELQALHDRVAPFDTDVATEQIADELGAPVGDLFAEFDPAPFAAGSMAQVYHARTKAGQAVVVKVKRPGIDRIMSRDLDLLASLARLAERHAPELRVYRPVMIVEELARTTKRELDFINEASNTERFREGFKDVKGIGIPAVVWETTSRNVLTIERLPGENLQLMLERGDAAIDRPALARFLCDAFMRQFFVTGLFHADPHPGNLLIVPPATVNLVDFGMVGHLTDEMRGHLGTMVLALVARDLDVLIDVFQDIGAVGYSNNVPELKMDILGILDKYYALPVGRVDATQAFAEFTEAARRHNVVLPREFVMLGRSFTTIAALAMQLDPSLNFGSVIQPHARRLVAEKVSPKSMGRRLLTILWQLGSLAGRTPRDLLQLARQAARGELQITVQHRHLEDLIAEIDRASSRLCFAITIAAILIASSMVIRIDVGPHLFGLSALGLFGYVVAGVLGLWLLIAILRSGRL